MKISRLLCALLSIGLVACSDAMSPRPSPIVLVRVVPVDSGGKLIISAIVNNPSSVYARVDNSATCPFAVRFYPDSIQQFEVPVPGAFCFGAPETVVPPRDSIILRRVFSPMDLEQYAPGLYTIEVTVAIDSLSSTSTEGGAVRLPLSSTP